MGRSAEGEASVSGRRCTVDSIHVRGGYNPWAVQHCRLHPCMYEGTIRHAMKYCS